MNELARRIERAGQGTPKAAPLSANRSVTMGRIGFDFVGAALGGALIGYLIDRVLPQLAPWGLLVMMIVGFAGGMLNVWRGLAVPDADKTNSDETKG